MSLSVQVQTVYPHLVLSSFIDREELDGIPEPSQTTVPSHESVHTNKRKRGDWAISFSVSTGVLRFPPWVQPGPNKHPPPRSSSTEKLGSNGLLSNSCEGWPSKECVM